MFHAHGRGFLGAGLLPLDLLNALLVKFETLCLTAKPAALELSFVNL
jgi:hypothetical protein